MHDRLRAGTRLSHAVFTRLVDCHQHRLHVYLAGLLGSADQAFDLVQETFYDAWRAAQRGVAPFLPGAGEDDVRRWLFRAGSNNALSLLRHTRLIRWESLDVSTEPVFVCDMDEPFEERVAECDALQAALATLSPRSAWGIGGLQLGGDASIFHFDGSSWRALSITGVVDASQASVVDFQMLSDDTGWALVITDQTSTGRYALARYSAGVWTIQAPLPGDGPAYYTALAMVSATEGWVLGQQTVADSHGITTHVPLNQLLYHYQNGKLSNVPLRITGGPFITLQRIVMLSPREGWIAGVEQRTYPGSTASGYQRHTILLHFSGGQWRQVDVPPTGTSVNQITGLAFTPDGHGWACGYLSDIPLSQTVQDSDITSRGSPLLWSYQNGAWTMYASK